MWRHEKGKNEKGSSVSVTLATPTMRAYSEKQWRCSIHVTYI